jgi:hypothetical protein
MHILNFFLSVPGAPHSRVRLTPLSQPEKNKFFTGFTPQEETRTALKHTISKMTKPAQKALYTIFPIFQDLVLETLGAAAIAVSR